MSERELAKRIESGAGRKGGESASPTRVDVEREQEYTPGMQLWKLVVACGILGALNELEHVATVAIEKEDIHAFLHNAERRGVNVKVKKREEKYIVFEFTV